VARVKSRERFRTALTARALCHTKDRVLVLVENDRLIEQHVELIQKFVNVLC
jgi:hypothetical protein